MRTALFTLFVLAVSAFSQAPAPAPAPAKQAAAKPAATEGKAVATTGLPSYAKLKYPPLSEVKIPDIPTSTLPNGIKLYLLENHELPLISGFALVRTGNLLDPEGKEGVADVMGEVMRTGGTHTKTGEQLDEALENIAASVESDMSETSASVSFSAMKDTVGQVLPLFKDVLVNPEFRQDKIDLVLNQIRGSIARRNDEASGIAGRELSKIIYGKDTPYGRELEYEDLNRVKREDLVAFHKRYFFPANTVIAISGDFSAAEMKAQIEKLFADWTEKQAPPPPFPAVKADYKPGVYVAVKDDVNQTFFQVGHLGGLLKDKDYPALSVLGDILGGGFSSRLFLKIRTEKGYAYNVGGGWGAGYLSPGLFRISGSTKSASTTDTLRLVRQEVERIRTSEVTDQELKDAKDTTLNSFVFNFDHPSKTLSRLVRYEYYGYPRDFIYSYQKAVEAVTKADILRVAKEHLKPETFAYVAVGKPSDFSEPLSKLGVPEYKIDLTIPKPKAEAPKADAGGTARAKALLVKAQAAMGGAAKLAAVKDFSMRGEMSAASLAGKQYSRWIAPDKYRIEQSLPMGSMTAYFNGTGGMMMGPQGKMAMPPPVVDQVRGTLFRMPFRLVMSDQIEGRTINEIGNGVVQISDGEGNDVKVQFDTATGLPAKTAYKLPNMGQGAPAEVEETYADWKDVDGVKLPHTMKQLQGGKQVAEIKVQEFKLNSGLKLEDLEK